MNSQSLFAGKVVRWLLVSIAVTLAVNVMAWVPSMGGALKLLPVQLLLPWACIISAHWWRPVFLSEASLLQWPIYAGLLFIASRFRQERKMIFVLALVHAVGFALSLAYFSAVPIGFPDL
jgi:hypothetical protein